MRAILLAATVAIATAAHAQQLPDRDFRPAIARPSYAAGAGPRLCLDEAHDNFHTLDNRFLAFGKLAKRDGYRVAPLRAQFSAASLAACDILVISNAQPSDAEWNTYPYPTPSAFSDAEIAAVRAWVNGGGRLLLIADHMPLAGAASKLAAAFGAKFTDGFAYPRAAWRAQCDDELPTDAPSPPGQRTSQLSVQASFSTAAARYASYWLAPLVHDRRVRR